MCGGIDFRTLVVNFFATVCFSFKFALKRIKASYIQRSLNGGMRSSKEDGSEVFVSFFSHMPDKKTTIII